MIGASPNLVLDELAYHSFRATLDRCLDVQAEVVHKKSDTQYRDFIWWHEEGWQISVQVEHLRLVNETHRLVGGSQDHPFGIKRVDLYGNIKKSCTSGDMDGGPKDVVGGKILVPLTPVTVTACSCLELLQAYLWLALPVDDGHRLGSVGVVS